MKDELITFETAVLAKEKGFNGLVYNCFIKGIDKPNALYNPYDFNHDKTFNGRISRSTQSLLARWLREIHSINILITCHQSNSSEITYDYCLFIPYGYQSKMTKWSKNNYKTYEEAFEDALQEGLNLIKK